MTISRERRAMTTAEAEAYAAGWRASQRQAVAAIGELAAEYAGFTAEEWAFRHAGERVAALEPAQPPTAAGEAYEAGWRAAEATMRQRALESAPTTVAVWVTTYLAQSAPKPASGHPGANAGHVCEMYMGSRQGNAIRWSCAECGPVDVTYNGEPPQCQRRREPTGLEYRGG